MGEAKIWGAFDKNVNHKYGVFMISRGQKTNG